MKHLKKFAALFIVASLSLCFTGYLSIETNAVENVDNRISFEEYSTLLFDLLNEYEVNNADNSEHCLKSGENESQQLKRLIVETYSNEALQEDCGSIDKVEGYDNVHILQYDTHDDAEAAYDYYSVQSYVNYVEYDAVCTLSSDAVFEEITASIAPERSDGHLSWGVDSTRSAEVIRMIEESGLELPEIIVGVLDTGVEDHSFFNQNPNKPRLLENDYQPDPQNFLLLHNKDAGLPGYIGHGTLVAGIIADNTPSNVKIKPYNCFFINDNELSWSAMSALITEMSESVNVINISLSVEIIDSESSYISNRVTKAINEATEKGVVVVVCAGNEREDVSLYYPANAENAITVTSVNKKNNPIWSSNMGSVDIAAPGGYSLESTLDIDREGICSTILENKYEKASGTSMAAPFVAAAAATLKSINPGLTASEIKERLIDTAYKPYNWDNLYAADYGAGIVNFYDMIEAERTAPPVITELDNDKLSISTVSSEPGTKIYYTTDGSSPTPDNSVLYAAPVDLSNDNIKQVKAIALEDGKIYSQPSKYIVRWTGSINLYYKAEEQLQVPQGKPVIIWTSDNTDVVSVDQYGNIKGNKKGTATVTAKIDEARSATYKITVTYNWWQWIIVIFLFGWIWY